MPRTRYTRLVHDRDEARLSLQIRALRQLAHELRHQPTEVIELPVLIDLKRRRRARLEQKRHHKPAPVVVATSA
ncbi:hypothetical protein L1857_08535 [Amycolatopsis thermalba]|uniref:Uncharacterized protein n=1 Tax=Amycolatopsis thermalba TaxID=944492 RepID=A0ABY4NS32_9PSEU|nr:hypothetical protein [Amycolatopsis thermalba]UQS22860.1 hypothetical protein L1857_08535 [Amycolatopsis thermalba]